MSRKTPAGSDVQIKMVFYRGLKLLLLDPDVTLGDGGAAVLKELLHQGHIIAIGLVDLGCEEFPEAVGADPFVAEENADKFQMFLNLAFCYPHFPTNRII